MPGFGPVGRRFLLVLPSMGLLAVAVAATFGVGARPFRSAEVYGGPTDAAGDYSVRVHVTERAGEQLADVPGERIVVAFEGPESESTVEGRVDDAGWIELRLPRPVGARGVRLRVTDPLEDVVLAEGEPVLPLSRWSAAARRRGGAIPGQSEGPVFVSARLREGVLSYPFLGHVEVTLRAEGGVDGSRVVASLEGGQLEGPREFVYREPGPLVLSLRPTEHSVTLRLETRRPAADSSTFQAVLPLVPAAGFAEWKPDGLLLRFPLVRPQLWYAFVTDQGRGQGGPLALREQADGTSRGLLPTASVPEAPAPRYIVVSSSPDGRSESSVGFPLDNQTGTFDALDGRLLDGAPEAEARERARSARVRRLLFVYVATVALLTLVLFVVGVRGANLELAQRMARAGVVELGPKRFSGALLVGALCLGAAFSALLVWVALTAR